MYLCRATTLASEQPPSGVTAEGGANEYGAFGRVCSIFPVLLFRGFRCNVPPRARFISVSISVRLQEFLLPLIRQMVWQLLMQSI
jgi:hypothetical protein